MVLSPSLARGKRQLGNLVKCDLDRGPLKLRVLREAAAALCRRTARHAGPARLSSADCSAQSAKHKPQGAHLLRLFGSAARCCWTAPSAGLAPAHRSPGWIGRLLWRVHLLGSSG